jgi:hypothetical protein
MIHANTKQSKPPLTNGSFVTLRATSVERSCFSAAYRSDENKVVGQFNNERTSTEPSAVAPDAKIKFE